jgi:ligand-binding SRPBCC domain-containing protein
MAAHSFKTVQFIPVRLEKAWDFFSNPANLPLITPSGLSFEVISKYHGDRMYPGQIIEYRVAPLAGVRLYWMTEITHVEELKYFVDEQRFGPYAMWHHQHFFRKVEGGTEMTDIVHYKNPLGFIGRLFDSVLTRPKLKQIFDYRRTKIEEIFGTARANLTLVE